MNNEKSKIIRIIYKLTKEFEIEKNKIEFLISISNPFKVPFNINEQECKKILSEIYKTVTHNYKKIDDENNDFMRTIEFLLESYNFIKLNSTMYGYKAKYFQGICIPTSKTKDIPKIEGITDYYITNSNYECNNNSYDGDEEFILDLA